MGEHKPEGGFHKKFFPCRISRSHLFAENDWYMFWYILRVSEALFYPSMLNKGLIGGRYK